MADTTFINRFISIDTFKHLTVTTTNAVTKHHYLKDSSKLYSLEFWVPFLITIGVFVLGQLATYYFKKSDKKSQLKNAKANLVVWVLQLEKSANILVEQCNTFCITLNAQKEVQRVGMDYSPTLINKISELDINEFLNFSTLNLEGSNDENAKRAFDIIQHIEYLRTAEDEIKKLYQTFLETTDKIMSDLNKGSKELASTQLSLLHEVGKNHEHVAFNFQAAILKHLNLWQASGSNYQDFANYEQNFIAPYLDIIGKEVDKNPTNPQTNVFADKVHFIRVAIVTWKSTQIGYVSLINKYSEDYDNTYKTLKTEVQTLEKKPLVNTWSIK